MVKAALERHPDAPTVLRVGQERESHASPGRSSGLVWGCLGKAAGKECFCLGVGSFAILFNHCSCQKLAVFPGFLEVFLKEGSLERKGKVPLEFSWGSTSFGGWWTWNRLRGVHQRVPVSKWIANASIGRDAPRHLSVHRAKEFLKHSPGGHLSNSVHRRGFRIQIEMS